MEQDRRQKSNIDLIFPDLHKWQDAINENAIISLVQSSCDRCKEYKQTMEKVAEIFKGTNLHFIDINIPNGAEDYCAKQINRMYSDDIVVLKGFPKVIALQVGHDPIELRSRNYENILLEIMEKYIPVPTFPDLHKWQDAINGNAIISLVQSGCGWCKRLKPHMKKLAENFKGTNMRIITINIPSGMGGYATNQINKMYDKKIIQIEGYPMIIALQVGHDPIVLKSNTYDEILSEVISYYKSEDIFPDIKKWDQHEPGIITIVNDEDKEFIDILRNLNIKLGKTRLNVTKLSSTCATNRFCANAINAKYDHNPIHSTSIPKLFFHHPNFFPIEIHERDPNKIREIVCRYYYDI